MVNRTGRFVPFLLILLLVGSISGQEQSTQESVRKLLTVTEAAEIERLEKQIARQFMAPVGPALAGGTYVQTPGGLLIDPNPSKATSIAIEPILSRGANVATEARRSGFSRAGRYLKGKAKFGNVLNAAFLGWMVWSMVFGEGSDDLPPVFNLPYVNEFEHPRSLACWSYFNAGTGGVKTNEMTDAEEEEFESKGKDGNKKRRLEFLSQLSRTDKAISELELQGWNESGKPWWVDPIIKGRTVKARGEFIDLPDVKRYPPSLWAIDATPGSMPGGAAYNSPAVTDPKMISRKSLNMNHPVTGTYETTLEQAKVSTGEIISPMIDIQPTSQPILTFWCNFDTGRTGEKADPQAGPGAGEDRRYVVINALDSEGQFRTAFAQQLTTQPDPDAQLHMLPCTRPGEWHIHYFPLENGWGTIQISFNLDAVDAVDNQHRGWFIDHLKVIDMAVAKKPEIMELRQALIERGALMTPEMIEKQRAEQEAAAAAETEEGGN